MKATLLYRIASVLLLLFAVGHTIGFSQVDPTWGANSLVASMKSLHFDVSGSNRTYWDFFMGFGLFVTALLVFAAIVAWQLGSLPTAILAQMRLVAWGFTVCLAVVAWLSWRYFFVVPLIFSVAILLCLATAAWLSGTREIQPSKYRTPPGTAA